jgi:hypothetical protein
MTFHSINPINGEPFAAYEEWQPREVFYDNEFRAHPIAATSIGVHDCDAKVDDSKRVIGVALRSHEDTRRVCEVKIAVKALNRMLELGRPICVRVA